ncbi:FxsA family membrane protein [Streptomyces sp. NPDC001070]
MTISSPPPAGPRQPGGSRPSPRRRPRAGTWIPLGVAAYALLEIWLLMLVAEAAGGLTVLLLLVAGFVCGALAVRHAGRSAWRALNAAMRSGGPEREPERGGSGGGSAKNGGSGAAPIMVGGLLLMVPGLISDVIGLLFLFPPTRSLLTRAGGRALNRRAAATHEQGSLGDLFAQARAADQQMRIHRPDGKVIQGEVVDRDPERDNENPGPRH